MKKLIALVLALCFIVFGSSLTVFAAEETQISLAKENLGRGLVFADLLVKWGDDDSITTDGANISFYLQEAVAGGETVTVHVKGSSDGDFRMWLIDVNETTNSNIYQMSQNNFTSGAFDITFELTATADATEFFFKAPTFDGKIDNLNVTYLSVTKGSAAVETAEEPVSEAAADTAEAAEVPKTGDATNLAAYIGLMAAALAGFVITRKKTVNE